MKKQQHEIIVGIDPGAKGAMAVLKDGKVIELVKFKTISSYRNYLDAMQGYDNVKIYLEEVHSMPGQGVKSMFSFGQRFGEIIGMLEAFRLDYNLVTPQQWQKEFNKKYIKKDNNPKDMIKNIIGMRVYASNRHLSKQLIKRTGNVNTDLTDAIAIAMSYSKEAK